MTKVIKVDTPTRVDLIGQGPTDVSSGYLIPVGSRYDWRPNRVDGDEVDGEVSDDADDKPRQHETHDGDGKPLNPDADKNAVNPDTDKDADKDTPANKRAGNPRGLNVKR